MCAYEEGRIEVINEMQKRQEGLLWHIRCMIQSVFTVDGEFFSKSNQKLVRYMTEYLKNREEIIRLCRDIDLIRAVLNEKQN